MPKVPAHTKTMKSAHLLRTEPNAIIGILYYAFGIFLNCGMGASAKQLSSSYSVVQIIFFFEVVALLFFLIPLGRLGYSRLLSLNWRLLVVRGVVAAGTIYCYFLALRNLIYAEVAAIFAVSPLIASLLSGWMLKETIGLSRWIPIGIGFIGALIIIQPGTISGNLSLLLPLGAAFFYALALVYAKILTRTEDILIILVYTYGIIAIGSLIFLPMFWVDISPSDALIFLAMGIFGALGNYFYIKGCRHAPVHVVAPFDYTALIWATLFGFTFWQEIPSVWTWLGSALVVAGGLHVLRQQRT